METERSWGKWVGIGSLLAAIAALVLTLTLWFVDRSTSSLKFEVVSKAGLDPVLPESVTSSVSVLLNGVPVRRPSYIVVDVVNSGTQPILSSSFERGIRLFAKPASIESAQVIGKSPSSLSPIVTVSSGYLEVSPLLLNPGDSFQLGVLTSGEIPRLAVSGRIAGVKDIALIDQLPSKSSDLSIRRFMAVLLGGVSVVCTITWLTHGRSRRFPVGTVSDLFGYRRELRPSVIFAIGIIAYIAAVAMTGDDLTVAVTSRPWTFGACAVGGMLIVFALARTLLFKSR
jgi:hypothetical protein